MSTLDALLDAASRLGRPATHVALAWLLDRPGVTAAIVGARTVEQIAQSVGAADLALDPSDRSRLDQASEAPLGYPYEMLIDAYDKVMKDPNDEDTMRHWSPAWR